MREDWTSSPCVSLDALEYGSTSTTAQILSHLRRRASPATSLFATIPEIIAEARAGHPFILVDSHDRENEGDIVIPAQFANDARVNFMARHGRGLICLTITPERAAELHLRPMVEHNGSPHGTAFTVSIEAAKGVSTGISARDRATTIAAAIDPANGPADLISPGHVFPLVAKPGGVLARPGHTEASVDIARLARLIPAGVICEIMNDDGSMARLPDLGRFARTHGLRIASIEDLIRHRIESESEAPGHD
jgi:3,4-dihydroxy 2-butanone 4-phosphate synthase/GTP cyclohydrolase II